MHSFALALSLVGCLIALVAGLEAIAARIHLPESTLLLLFGSLFGLIHLFFPAIPGIGHGFFTPLFSPAFSAEGYLWLFLPPLLFQAALTVDVKNILSDWAPVLLLAVVGVGISTLVVGGSLAVVSEQTLIHCLILGAIVATTDPTAVLRVFRELGAPTRLMTLVEGESLLNDAAAIAIVSVLLAMLGSDPAQATLGRGLGTLTLSLIGGILTGVLFGRLAAALLPWLERAAPAETAMTLGLPYPLYLFADQILHVSGVVAVVSAGLMLSALGRTRLAPRSWTRVQAVWGQIAFVAGATVIFVAAVRIPELLSGINLLDLGLILVVVVAALVARLLVLYVLLPPMTWLKLNDPVSSPYRLVIAWGGLRGAVTLVLALGIAQSSVIGTQSAHLLSLLATGFVIFTLLINGTTLQWLIRVLRLNVLSRQEQFLQKQAIELSVAQVDRSVSRVSAAFQLPESVSQEVTGEYRRSLEAGAGSLDIDAVTEVERLATALVALATRERELIPDFGNGAIAIRNLDAMMRNTEGMIEAARLQGRIGYNRAAKRILRYPWSYRLALFLYRRLGISRPLEIALTNRFELVICRRAALERLRDYIDSSLAPIFGERLATLLHTILEGRVASLDEALAAIRHQFGAFTLDLERRLLLLVALRRGLASIELMASESVISEEVHNKLRQSLVRGWQRHMPRPRLRKSLAPRSES